VPGHEKGKVLPLAEENSNFFVSDCRSFGALVTVTILMTDVFCDVILSLGEWFSLSQILQNIWNHLPSNGVSHLGRFESLAHCCGDLKNRTKTS